LRIPALSPKEIASDAEFQKLLEWIQGQAGVQSGIREIPQFGPNALPTKGAAEEALAILASHGWV
jgi:hypothetical protein